MKDYKEEKIWDFSISGKFSKYQYRRTLNDMYKRKSYYHSRLVCDAESLSPAGGTF